MTGTATELVRRAAGLTLGGMVEQSIAFWPDRVAVEWDGGRLTYAQLGDRSARACALLAAYGVRRGDRFAIVSENRVEYLELLVAAARIGAIACCQNWRQSDRELAHCMMLVGARLVFASERFTERVISLGLETPIIGLGTDYESALGAASSSLPGVELDPEDGVVILYTSGTTGLPKAALISQRAEIARASVMGMDLPSAADEAFVAWAPLFHMVSTDPSFAAFLRGAKVIVMDGFDAERLARITVEEKLGHLVLMPGMITSYLDALQALGKPARGVHWVGVMADLVPRAQLKQITTLLDAPYLNSFGSTETGSPPGSGGHVRIGVTPETLDKTKSALCHIRLVDADDRDVGVGEVGELAIRTTCLFSGYWNDEAATLRDFRGGWFHMGDVFRRNADGTLTFVDRRKYLIKSGGENIYPAEVEQALMTSPKVADAVVVRQLDEQWGEVPVAFVVRNDETLTEIDVVEICTRHIGRYKRPRRVLFVHDADLPRSTTGKVVRHELEAALASGKFDL